MSNKTTPTVIREWLEEADKKIDTHMIVVCDTFDWDDYPVYVSKSEDINEVIDKYDNKNMQRVIEVYNLSMNIQKQLNEKRCWNL